MSAPVPRTPRQRRRWVRVLWWALALVVGVPLLYLLAAFGLALIPVNGDFRDAPADEGVEVFLVSNGVHVDFLVPVTTAWKDWSREFPRADFEAVDETFTGLLVGWGDRRFYLETPTWADLTVPVALNAVLWPSATVIHAQYVDWRPQTGPGSEPSSRRVVLAAAAYRELCEFLSSSCRRDGSGAPVLLPGKGYGPTDNFYKAEGSYHAFNTCNLWTNRGLWRSGVRTALWSPFAQGLLRHLPERDER
jgi:uncharacterized protein (TIGR02117 family)